MRVLGVDPSSRYAGAGLVAQGRVQWVRVWSPSKTGIDEALKLGEFDRWITFQIAVARPDLVAVELMRRGNSTDAVRVVGYFEAITVVAAVRAHVPVKRILVRTARKHVLGNGNMPKEDVYKVVKRMFPNQSFKRFEGGGSDQADAIVLGLAGPNTEIEG